MAQRQHFLRPQISGPGLLRAEPWLSSGLGLWVALAELPTLYPQSGHGSSCPGTYARPSRGESGSP